MSAAAGERICWHSQRDSWQCGHCRARGDDGKLIAYPWHGVAASTLKGLNAEKRRAQVPSPTTDAGPVEYLYGTLHYWPDDGYGTEVREVVPFRITRKTPKRIYYVRRQHGPDDVVTGYVDRLALERDGEVRNRGAHWWENDARMFATREAAGAHLGLGRETVPGPDLRQLRREMAAAHPDAGGSSEAFIAARQRYERALRRVS